MAMVLTFWRFPEEETALLQYLRTTGEIVVFRSGRIPDPRDVSPRSLDDIARGDPHEVLLGLAEHARELHVDEHRDGEARYFVVNLMHSPVIAYKRGKIRASGKLGGCNLAAYTSFPSDDHIVDKSGEFIKWAKKVYRWVRAETSVQISKGWRATSAVAAAMQKGLEIEP